MRWTEQERTAAIASAAERVQDTLAELKKYDLTCRIIGGAGTGTFEHEAASGIWNACPGALSCSVSAGSE